MKWIKKREQFLTEAKLRDIILPKQSRVVSERWGERFLEYEEIDPTDKIIQGKWKLSDEDKFEVLGAFFKCDINGIFKRYEKLPEKFLKLLEDSVDIDGVENSLKEKMRVIFENFNASVPTIDQLSMFYDNCFRLLTVSETKADSKIQRDRDGVPMRDSDNKIIKVAKEVGDPVFSKNYGTIIGFAETYNACYEKEKVDVRIFTNDDMQNLVSFSKENHNKEFKFDFKIFDRDIYLSIKHDPKQILNMSISKFYSSCMQLYTGGYNSKVLSNVFDPNSIPAFLLFDSDIFWGSEKISDFLPLCRMMVRNIETFDNKTNDKVKIFFDRCYPDRMEEVMKRITSKYSGNENMARRPDSYYFTPDVDINDRLDLPYMDRIGDTVTGTYIGKNTKMLYLNRAHDWSKVKIAPNANIKELIIETETLPSNLPDIALNPEWVKFKYIKINNLDPFKNLKCKSLSFDKCKFDFGILANNDVEKIQLISCDLDLKTISNMKLDNLKELQILFSLNDLGDLKELIGNIDASKLTKLVLSSDLFVGEEGKKYLRELKNNRINVEVKGPKI